MSLDEQDAAWGKLVFADREFDYTGVVESVHKLLRVDPSITLQQLEMFLRLEGKHTFLAARVFDAEMFPGLKCVAANGADMPYMLHVTVTSDDLFGNAQITKESGSIDENLRRLVDTGFLTPK
jgi:hypothetical protein